MITDHALLRWIERVHDVDVEKLRKMVADHCRPDVNSGAKTFKIGALWAVCEAGSVLTFLPTKPSFEKLKRHENARKNRQLSEFAHNKNKENFYE